MSFCLFLLLSAHLFCLYLSLSLSFFLFSVCLSVVFLSVCLSVCLAPVSTSLLDCLSSVCHFNLFICSYYVCLFLNLCLSVCLSTLICTANVCLCVTIILSICFFFVHLPVCLSYASLFIHLLSVFLSTWFCAALNFSVSWMLCLTALLFVRLSVYLSICLSVYLSVCLSVNLPDLCHSQLLCQLYALLDRPLVRSSVYLPI